MHRFSVTNKKAVYLYFSFSVRHLLFVTSKSTWVSVDHHNGCSVLASRFFGSALATAWACLRGIYTRTTSRFRRLLTTAGVPAGTSLRKGKQMRYNGRKDIEQLAYRKLFHSLPLNWNPPKEKRQMFDVEAIDSPLSSRFTCPATGEP